MQEMKSIGPLRRIAAARACAMALSLLFVATSALSPQDIAVALRWPNGAPISDKLVHACAFFGLGALGLTFYRHTIATTCALFAFGAALEGAQALMGLGRDADWRDAAANGAGLAIAALCVTFLRRARGANNAPTSRVLG